MATVEKALVDCADHPEHCGGLEELAKALGNAAVDLDADTLSDYLLRQGNGAAVKRVVYLADLLEIELSDRDRLVDAFTSGYSRLDPTRPEAGHHDSTYRLKLNVPEEELRSAGDPG